MSNEIVEQKANPTPAELIQSAVAGGADLDKLEKLLALQERWEKNEARKAYHRAMAEFKANPPKIEKDKRVGYATQKGNVGYSHATLGNVTEKINTELSKYGLSASWTTSQNGKVVVTCKITHSMGHSEETSLEAEADTSGSKNSIQAIGSTITYLERYTLLALTGLATYEQDDDGKTAVELVDDKQLHILRDNLLALESDEGKFCAYLKIEKLEDLPKSDFNKAITVLQAKKKDRDLKAVKK